MLHNFCLLVQYSFVCSNVILFYYHVSITINKRAIDFTYCCAVDGVMWWAKNEKKKKNEVKVFFVIDCRMVVYIWENECSTKYHHQPNYLLIKYNNVCTYLMLRSRHVYKHIHSTKGKQVGKPGKKRESRLKEASKCAMSCCSTVTTSWIEWVIPLQYIFQC